MQWTDDVHRFDGPSGPKSISVNGDAGRWALDKVSSQAIARAVDVTLDVPKKMKSIKWRSFCATLSEVEDHSGLKALLESATSMSSGTTYVTISACLLRLLGALRLEGVLLWPPGLRSLPHICRGDASPWIIMLGYTDYERSLMSIGPSAAKLKAGTSLFLSCSPAKSADDLRDDALLKSVQIMAGSAAWVQWKNEQRGLTLLGNLEGRKRSDGTVVSILLPAQDMLHDAEAIGPRLLRYGPASTRADAAPWLEVFARLSAVHKKKRAVYDEAAWSLWLKFLASLGCIPAPSEINRDQHIIGPSGFIPWLNERKDQPVHGFAHILSPLSSLLTFLVSEGVIARPLIFEDDFEAGSPTWAKSNKAVLPRGVVEMAREVCREILELAFVQFNSLSNQSWKPAGLVPEDVQDQSLGAVEQLPQTLLTRAAFTRIIVTIRSEDGTIRRIINPVRALAMLWSLKLPTRGGETTFLDSGEADEWTPSVREAWDESGIMRVSVGWTPNTHSLATKGRMVGAICAIPDTTAGTQVTGFYVNTDKSQRGGHADGADRGRYIPWSDPEMLLMFDRLRVWQGHINPVDRLLDRNQIRIKRLRTSDGLAGKLTGYTYLFRCLDDSRLGRRLEPLTTEMLQGFFDLVLDEVDARLRSETVDDGSTLSLQAEQPSLRTQFSLHCLRVTGITGLLEDGVPFWIVSEVLAGHSCWKMTQGYNKPSPGKINNILAQAQFSLNSGALEAEAVRAARLPSEALEETFVSDHQAALATTGAQPVGFWLPMIDGICPNGATRCHEGGRRVDGSRHHHPVDGGGRNCGLCRFFLTGERFIPGQVVMINGLLHQARRQARGMQELWIKRRAEAHPGRRRQLDERIAHAEATVDVTISSVNARVRLLRKSEALADAVPASPDPVGGDMLITRLDKEEIRATMRRVSELAFLDEVSRVAALVPELDVQDAPVERNAVIDLLLEGHGYEGLLGRLPRAAARAVGDAFTDAVRALAPAGIDPSNHLDMVADGRVALLEPDAAAVSAEMSRAVGMAVRLVRREGSIRVEAASGGAERSMLQGDRP